jgi:hypothetical protein
MKGPVRKVSWEVEPGAIAGEPGPAITDPEWFTVPEESFENTYPPFTAAPVIFPVMFIVPTDVFLISVFEDPKGESATIFVNIFTTPELELTIAS